MENKKKILFILHLPQPVHGAAMVGKWIQESQMINGSIDADYINLSTSHKLDEIGKGKIQKIKTILKLQKRVVHFLLRNKYDLCYMTLTAKGAGFYKDLLIVSILKMFRKNIIYHFHNKGVKANSNSFLNRALYKFAFKGTKSMLLSQHLYKDIAQYVNKEDVYFCANGIKDISYNNTTPEISNNETCNFLFLSNMMEEKGVLTLLEACKELKDQHVNCKCHFIGAWSDITEEKFYNKVEELNISSMIFAHGKKYGEDKLEFFAKADVFVFPTYYHNETFGLVLLEAMQASLPVISTFEGGIPDVVKDGETGILINGRNSKELAKNLKWMTDNPSLRRKMGVAGHKRYKEHFTMNRFENNFLSIIKNAATIDDKDVPTTVINGISATKFTS